jgi:hypothetical protein
LDAGRHSSAEGFVMPASKNLHNSDRCTAANRALIDHRIGAQQDRIRDFDTDCPWGSLGGANQGSILDAD